MPAYGVAQIQIEDRERYGQYEAGFMQIFGQYGGEILAVDDNPSVVEGEWPFTRVVILRFADEAAAETWYRSSEYQDLMKHRLAASTATLLFAKGIG